MTLKEKARRSGEPIPNAILAQDCPESNSYLLSLQASRLTRRCAITTAMAAIIAPLVFGEVSR